MGWKECVDGARNWTTSDNSQFELSQKIEAERKLVFKSFSGDVSFFVVIPENSNSLVSTNSHTVDILV